MMNKGIKTAFVFVFGLIVAAASFAYTPEEIINPTRLEELKEKGFLREYFFKKDTFELTLVPDTQFKDILNTAWKSSEKPSFVIENLYLIPKKDLGNGDCFTANIPHTSQVMRNISLLQGIEYYSNSDKKYKVLYKDAYCIDGPKSKVRIDDNKDESADGLESFIMLNDASFGKTNYQLNYFQTDNEVGATFTNTTSMWVGPIKAVSENNVIIYMMVADCGDDLVFYLVCEAKIPAISFLEDTIYESFSARLDATYKWIMTQY